MPDDDLPESTLKGDAKIIAEAKRRFEYARSWESNARKNWVEDTKFANGDSVNNYQWDSAVRGVRVNKPSLTINKTRQHNLQIINDAKQNKPGVNIRPTGGEATYQAAQVFEDIVRFIEYQSNAEVAYDTATVHQVQAGKGYWRVVTDYADDKSFDQDIFIKRVPNPLSVYLDPDIKEFDGCDAAFGFVFEEVPRDRFKREYPGDMGGAGQSVLGVEGEDGWITEDHVRVAEYYRCLNKRDTLFFFSADGQQMTALGSEMGAAEKAMVQALRDADPTAVQTRTVMTDRVEWFKIAGDKIIDRRDWPGKYIPLVRVIGEETVIEGKYDCKGHTRYMMDAQRAYNYWPLSLDTPLPTPAGWTTMGDVKVGDYILDVDGMPTRVKGMSQIFTDRKCYRVVFDDGSEIIADGQHPWVVEERVGSQDWATRKITTEEMRPGDHYIGTPAPIELPEANLPVDPYILGVWLGDGRSNGGEIAAGVDDAPVMARELALAGADAGQPVANSSGMRIPLYGLVGDLRRLGVLNNKHIPAAYLRGSYTQRLALLQGLMDTDGGINKATYQCSFDNSAPALMAGMMELLHTFGIKAFKRAIPAARRTFPSGNSYDCLPSERVSFSTDLPVFRMGRKAAIQDAPRNRHPRRTKRFAIRSVTEVPSVPVRCVSIESSSHLFLAGPSMVPTHNTSEATAQVALQTKTPWTAPIEGIENLEEYYRRANLDEAALLPYNQYTEDGNKLDAPRRVDPPIMATAYIQGMQIAQNEMMMSSGQYQSQFGQNENATSGKAINERQRQGDTATYHFIDNLAVAIRFTGKILIDLIPKIYDTERVVRIMSEDGTQTAVKIDPQAQQALQQVKEQQEQQAAVIFNPAVGRYEVESDIGPGYATRRQEAFNAMTQIAAQNKEFMQIAGDLLWRSADFPLANELAERWSRTIPAAVKGEGPPAEVQQLQQGMQQMQDAIVQLQQKLDNKQMDAAIKIDQKNIDSYDAETRRIVAIGNSGPYVTQEQVQPLILQTIMQMLRAGPPEGAEAAPANDTLGGAA